MKTADVAAKACIVIACVMVSYLTVGLVLSPVQAWLYSNVPGIGHFLPISEEFFKLIFMLVSSAFGFIYTITFALIEYHSYMSDPWLPLYANVNQFALIRGIVVVMHLVFVLPTYFGVKFYRRRKKVIYLIFFFLLAVLLHVVWNEYIGRLVSDLTKQWFAPVVPHQIMYIGD